LRVNAAVFFLDPPVTIDSPKIAVVVSYSKFALGGLACPSLFGKARRVGPLSDQVPLRGV
jgi:hypothetical protein